MILFYSLYLLITLVESSHYNHLRAEYLWRNTHSIFVFAAFFYTETTHVVETRPTWSSVGTMSAND